MALKLPRFFVFKKEQKKHVEVTSIIHALKLYYRNSSVLTCRRNFDIDSTCWVCWYNRTKFVLVSTQNHCCFNVKFWCSFNVDKMTLFRRWNTVISWTLISTLQFLKHYIIRTKMVLWSTQNQRCFNVKFHVDLMLINWHCFDVEIRLSFQCYIKF